ncbi:MAG TPA: hypothetical protein VE664_01355 [Actinomycetes bacterium]|jgi:hypothetical protein|nr:hypothetical protein [Actinomycetes bacterium]
MDFILTTLGYAIISLIGLIIVLGLVALALYEINWIIHISCRSRR